MSPSVPAADREVQRILLELLNQMDGFDQNVNVKVRPSGHNGGPVVLMGALWWPQWPYGGLIVPMVVPQWPQWPHNGPIVPMVAP